MKKGDLIENEYTDLVIPGFCNSLDELDAGTNQIWFVLNAVAQDINMKLAELGVELDGEWVSFPQLRYMKSGRSLNIQGMAHLAVSTFYERVQEVIDIHDGAILFEKVLAKKATPLINSLEQKQRAESKKTGLVKESDCIKYPAHAVRADVLMSDIQKSLDLMPELQTKHAQAMARVAKWCPDLLDYQTRHYELEKQGLLAQLEKIFFPQKKSNKSLRESVLVDKRNDVLFGHIEEQTQNTLVTYGADHVAGLHQLLIVAGWKLEKIGFIHTNVGPMPKLWKVLLQLPLGLFLGRNLPK